MDSLMSVAKGDNRTDKHSTDSNISMTMSHHSTMDDLSALASEESGVSMEQLDLLYREQVFNLSSNVVYFPVRHHSPACSFHLFQAIEAYKPQIILIEGPESADPLIQVLTDEATVPPVSLYCTYETNVEKAAFYYPLLSYSPEYVAMREAVRQNIPVHFIDLDVRPRFLKAQSEADILAEKEGQEQGRDRSSLQDETLLTSSAFMDKLCESLNCRNFDELWERLFEIRGLQLRTTDFAREVFTYCTLSRMCYTLQRLQEEGELEREQNMRRHISQAVQNYERVLVVTGGFHTYGLLDRGLKESGGLERQAEEVGKTTSKEASKEASKDVSKDLSKDLSKDVSEEVETTATTSSSESTAGTSEAALATHDSGAVSSVQYTKQMYPMIYTFAEADRLNGYASGMPYVNYYELAWTHIERSRQEPYTRTSLQLLTALTHRLREQKQHVSTSDAIEAYAMLQGLAHLRSKHEGGVYELLDAVLSAFVKGEYSIATSEPFTRLKELLTGDKIGQIAPNDWLVPIVEDFKRHAAAAKLQIKTTARHKKTLDLYARPDHRRISQLLHCVSFLVPEFAEKNAGPDWLGNRNMNLVRETWTYSYSALIEARLIENSIFGGTLQAAAVRKLEEAATEIPGHHSGRLADLLLHALLMGLQELASSLYGLVRAALRMDGSLLSLCQTLRVLYRLQQHGVLLGLRDDEQLPQLLVEAYRLAVDRLPSIIGTAPDEHNDIVEGLKLLAMLSSTPDELFDSRFREQLTTLLEEELPPLLEGVCMALAVSAGDRSRAEIAQRTRGYVRGTPEQVQKSALYLQGLFTAGRDVFLYDDELLIEVNRLLEELPHEEFIAMVAELRLAFTNFTPMETSLIADRVAHLLNSQDALLEEAGVEEQELLRAQALDDALRKEFITWMLINTK